MDKYFYEASIWIYQRHLSSRCIVTRSVFKITWCFVKGHCAIPVSLSLSVAWRENRHEWITRSFFAEGRMSKLECQPRWNSILQWFSKGPKTLCKRIRVIKLTCNDLGELHHIFTRLKFFPIYSCPRVKILRIFGIRFSKNRALSWKWFSLSI